MTLYTLEFILGSIVSFVVFLLAMFNYPPYLHAKDMVMGISSVVFLACALPLLCEYMGWYGIAGVVRKANSMYNAEFSLKYCIEEKFFIDYERGLFLFKHKDKWHVFGLEQYRYAEADGNVLNIEFDDESIPVVTIETTKICAKEWASRMRRFGELGAK